MSRSNGPSAIDVFDSLDVASKPAIEAIAFWLGVSLPVVYLLLLATGLSSDPKTLLFVGLLVLHVLCLLVGHSYRG